VLGVLPLFPDVFGNAMATAIMAGVYVGAGLTIVLFPSSPWQIGRPRRSAGHVLGLRRSQPISARARKGLA